MYLCTKIKHSNRMKKVLIILIITIFQSFQLGAQNTLNNAADNIVGTYLGTQNGDNFNVKIVKLANGTYRGQVIWMEHDTDAQGNKRLDTKNPDKSLRNTPCDRIILFSGLKYDASDKEWNGTKIYDPQRGMKAKMVARFEKDGRLSVKGSVLGIGETVYWKKIKK